ncbi:hypothetical protein AnigIFM63309_003586, partial [Aspergillus niger]
MLNSRGSNEAAIAFYRYDPSMGAAVLFILIFICPTGYDFFKWLSLARGFSSPLSLVAYVDAPSTVLGYGTMLTRIVEIIGYIGRAVSSQQTPNWTLGPYIVQTLFLLLALALLAASVYMFLGRSIVLLQAESHALLRRKWLTKIFVTGDVLSFLLQGA